MTPMKRFRKKKLFAKMKKMKYSDHSVLYSGSGLRGA